MFGPVSFYLLFYLISDLLLILFVQPVSGHIFQPVFGFVFGPVGLWKASRIGMSVDAFLAGCGGLGWAGVSRVTGSPGDRLTG